MPTTVELLATAWGRVNEQQDEQPLAAAKREFALAKTAIEDAIMRFNRGMAESRGTRHDFDFEVTGDA